MNTASHCRAVKQQDQAEAAAFGDASQCVITVRLNSKLRDRLIDRARERKTSMNLLVRKLLLQEATR